MGQYGITNVNLGRWDRIDVELLAVYSFAVNKQESSDLLSITSFNLTGTLNIRELENPEHPHKYFAFNLLVGLILFTFK